MRLSAAGVPLTAHIVGDGREVRDPDSAWPAAYGVDADGAVLVRPDGYVAFRSRAAGADAADRLESALRATLARTVPAA